MTTELTNLPCGTVQLKVCVNHLCELGWVTSHHLVPTKEAQLKQALRHHKTNKGLFKGLELQGCFGVALMGPDPRIPVADWNEFT